jgi:hypothetical protein
VRVSQCGLAQHAAHAEKDTVEAGDANALLRNNAAAMKNHNVARMNDVAALKNDDVSLGNNAAAMKNHNVTIHESRCSHE